MLIENITDWLGPAAPLAPILVRNAYGWLANSLEDHKIEKWEWQKLGSTMLKLGAMALFLSLGFDMDAFNSAIIVSGLDAVRNDLLEPIFKAIGNKNQSEKP